MNIESELAEMLRTIVNRAAAAEREACAQLVDDLVAERVPASTYSHAIRARGIDNLTTGDAA